MRRLQLAVVVDLTRGVLFVLYCYKTLPEATNTKESSAVYQYAKTAQIRVTGVGVGVGVKLQQADEGQTYLSECNSRKLIYVYIYMYIQGTRYYLFGAPIFFFQSSYPCRGDKPSELTLVIIQIYVFHPHSDAPLLPGLTLHLFSANHKKARSTTRPIGTKAL